MITCEFTDEGVQRALEYLLPDVAETLRREGCKGAQDAEDRCPVAVFMSRAVPDAEAVQVDDTRVLLIRDGVDQDGFAFEEELRVPILPEVKRFVYDFDDGEYPDLIDEGDEDDEPPESES